MEELSTKEAQAQFARLIDRARKGEETLITDHGRPVARLTAVLTQAPGASWKEVYLQLRTRAHAGGVGSRLFHPVANGRSWQTASFETGCELRCKWLHFVA